MQLVPLVTLSKSGIKRDGTEFEGDFYVDGQWVRWDRGFPRKQWGYRELSAGMSGPVTGMFGSYGTNVANIFTGTDSKIQRIQVNPTTGAALGPPIDRTPGGFATVANSRWTFGRMYNSAATNSALIAHVAPTALDINSDAAGLIYYDNINGTGALVNIAIPAGYSASGGAVVVPPFMLYYGSYGQVAWSDANQPTVLAAGLAGTARVTAEKIVAARVLRGGGGYSPAGLLWSLDSVIRFTYSNNSTVFSFDTLTDQSSIIAQNSVVKYDEMYVWIGAGRFFLYNGTVSELPNPLNRNYFFDNLNWPYANKIVGYAVPYWGEIRWAYPRGTATHNTHEIVWNVRESQLQGYPVWYDCELPNGGRDFAENQVVSRYPFMMGVTDASGTGTGYSLWQHEFGLDEVRLGPTVNAIPSWFETADITAPVGGGSGAQLQPMDVWLNLQRIEPDFVYSGTLDFQVRGKPYAMAPIVNGRTYSWPDTSVTTGSQQYIVPAKEEFREMRIKMTSNQQGGDYQMGQLLLGFADPQVGDEHQ